MSNQEEIDTAAIHGAEYRHLVHLGLLRPSFRRLRKGEPPEFDEETGVMKASGHNLTSLGRMLLCRIGVAEPGEY